MNSEIERVTLTVSNSSLKQSCSVSTSVTSALEVNFNNMRNINSHFTLLYFTSCLLFYHRIIVNKERFHSSCHLGETAVGERQQFQPIEQVVFAFVQKVSEQSEPRVPRQRRVARILNFAHSTGHYERRDLGQCEPTAPIDRTYNLQP